MFLHINKIQYNINYMNFVGIVYLKFFSVVLVQFSNQKLHFQNDLFNLHII